MINIGDTFFPLIPTPFDSKLCNFYYSGSNIIIETIAQYKTRVSINYRIPGLIITVLLPKTGYTLLSSYSMSTFASVLSNFDFKYYTYKDGVADGNFIELVLADISTLVQKDGDKVLSDNNFSDEEQSKLESLKISEYSIILPSNSTVAGRCLMPTLLPDGWSVSATGSGVDLLITHNLNRYITNVTIFSIDGTTGSERLLLSNAAFSGILSNSNKLSLIVESLATVPTAIRINLTFN